MVTYHICTVKENGDIERVFKHPKYDNIEDAKEAVEALNKAAGKIRFQVKTIIKENTFLS